MGKKRKSTEDGELELPKKRQTSRVAKESEKRLIVVLEGAHLETCKVRYGTVPLVSLAAPDLVVVRSCNST